MKDIPPDGQRGLQDGVKARGGQRTWHWLAGGEARPRAPTGPSPAHNVADDVGVADEDLITVLLLLGVCPVDVVPEGGLNPGSVFIILLGAE